MNIITPTIKNFLCRIVLGGLIALPLFSLEKATFTSYSMLKKRITKASNRGIAAKSYNPVLIAQKNLLNAHNYLETKTNIYLPSYKKILNQNDRIGDSQHFSSAIKEYFSNYLDRKNKRWPLYYTQYEKYYKISPPWLSGMAQGHAILLLTADSIRSPHLRTSEYILPLFNTMIDPIHHGGTAVYEKNLPQYIWFEEYSDKSSHNQSPLVLNGNIFSIDSLFWLYNTTTNSSLKHSVKKVLTNSIITVDSNITHYDSGFWSYYDRRGTLASRHYHSLHIIQLERLESYSKLLRINSDKITSTKNRYKLYEQYAFLSLPLRALHLQSSFTLAYFSLCLLFALLFSHFLLSTSNHNGIKQ